MNRRASLIFGIVALCFFLSGMAGLVYQIVWTRYLSLFLGHTSYAVVAVLVAFMGGLALGNAWLGAKADFSKRPLAFYGWLEIIIGLYALLFPFYYTFCEDLYVVLARALGSNSGMLLVLKFFFSLITILLPTVMMGATFPVLTKFVTRSLGELREKVAALYAINSTGAVFGCWVADFWWVPAVGLESTVWAGAAINLLVGVVSLAVSNRIMEGETPPPEETKPEEHLEQFSATELRLAMVGIGISGFVAMLYEVIWTRILALALGSSTHAFSIMLMTFITGIAIGAWIIYRWKRLKNTLQAFAWAEIALAMTLFVSMYIYDLLPYWFNKMASMLVRTDNAYPLYELFQMLICAAVMLIPTICLGMTLPLVSRIATAELARTGRSVGKVFAVNTLGTVLGASVSGLVLLPWFGLAQTLGLGIFLNLLVGAMVLLRNYVPRQALWFGIGPVLAGLFMIFTGWQFDELWKRVFSFGLYRHPDPPKTLADYRIMTRPFDLAYYKDGAGSSVCVAEWQDEGKQQFTLRVNGKAEASTTGDVSTQLLCGHIPMLLRPQSQDVLVIGLGSGMTCSAVARHPSIQRLDVAEISPEVVEAAHYFRNHNDQLLQNPKVRVVIEDAKSFLKITDHKYDVIVSEPSNPWMAGVAAVFSREYYENCRSRLKEDGIMTQWLQAYETNEEAMNTVFATFTAVFPFMSVWQGTLGDIILIGSTQPLKVDLGALEQRFQDERVKSDLARFQLTSVVAFLSREVISQQHGQFIVPPNTPQHSDYYPTLEYLAQRALFTRRQGEAWRVFDETYSLRPTTLLADYLKSRPITEEDFLVFARMYEKEHLIPGPLMRSLIYRWQKDHPQTITTLEMLVQLDDMRQSSELEVFRLTPAREFLLKYSEKSPGLLRYYEKAMMLTYRSHRSVFFQPPARELERVIHRLLETDPANRRVYHLHLAELAWDRGDDEAFFALAEKALDPDTARGGPVNFANDPKAPGLILARMADTYFRKGQLAQALHIAVNAREQKYLEPSSTYYHPLLDMVCRKIEAATAAP